MTDKLKTDLKIKYLTKLIDAAVEWNFGYSPTDSEDFDNYLAERGRLLEHARINYKDLYDKWIDIL